jgi:hypothetical protein
MIRALINIYSSQKCYNPIYERLRDRSQDFGARNGCYTHRRYSSTYTNRRYITHCTTSCD